MENENDTPDSTTETTQNPAELESAELYNTMKQWFMSDSAHSDEWRQQARDDFDFKASEQLDEKTIKKMERKNRPHITFNRVLPIIKAVAGIEVNTRQETSYLPRGTDEGVVIANENLSAASQWMGEQCDAQHEESEAFQDMLTCGMGWTEERLDYELEPDGKYLEQEIDPLEMYWDCNARKPNLSDSRRRWRVRKMTLGDAKAMYPEVADQDLNCSWSHGINSDKLQAIEDRRLKLDTMNHNDPKSMVTILQCQWWEREKYHRVANPFTNAMEEHDDKSLKDLQKQAKDATTAAAATSAAPQGLAAPVAPPAGPLSAVPPPAPGAPGGMGALAVDPNAPPQDPAAALGASEVPPMEYPVEFVTQFRRVYKQAFVGGKILKVGACPREKGFTLHCITGELHKTKGTFFGLVKVLRPPQKMANKWLSQATHIIDTTAKGGILAEEDAFKDIRDAEDSYSSPDKITWLKSGAISKGKIMAKPGVGMASPYVQLLTLALDAMPQVTGINMEMMGMRDVNQPGVLEAHRKQAAMTILATMFDNLTRFRVEVGRTRLYFIQNYMSDGRLIRILGKDATLQTVALTKDKTVGEFDVVVTDAPSSPNQKEMTWAAIQPVLQTFGATMPPQLIVTLLEYAPGIPQKLLDALKDLIQSQAQSPDAQEQKQLAVAGQTAKINRDNAAADKDKAIAKKSLAESVITVAGSIGENLLTHAKAAREVALATHAKAKTIRELVPAEEPPLYDTGTVPQAPPPPMLPTAPPQLPSNMGPLSGLMTGGGAPSAAGL